MPFCGALGLRPRDLPLSRERLAQMLLES